MALAWLQRSGRKATGQPRLAVQYFLWTIAFSTALSLLFTGFETVRAIIRTSNDTAAEQELLIDAYVDIIALDLWQFDLLEVDTGVEALVSSTAVDFAVVNANTIIVSAGEPFDGRVIERSITLRSPTEERKEIGRLTLRRSVQPIYRAQLAAAGGRLLTNFVRSSLVVAFSLFAFRRIVGDRLLDVARFLGANDPIISEPVRLELERPALGRRDPDELDDITNAINDMNATLAANVTKLAALQDDLSSMERTQALTHFAAIVAHDVNNALMAPLAICRMAESEDETEERLAAFRHIETGLMDVASIVSNLTITGSADAKPELVDLVELASEVCRLVEFRTRNLAVEVHGPTELAPIRGMFVPSEIREILLNLALNSIDSVNGSGLVQINCCADGERAMVTIKDNGAGMDAETLENARTPFFTTKGSKGTGLGLASVDAVIDRYAGELLLTSEPGVGTEAVVVLRRHHRSGHPPAGSPRS